MSVRKATGDVIVILESPDPDTADLIAERTRHTLHHHE
jgi:hypothetical protein